jgi:hypothetical protein
MKPSSSDVASIPLNSSSSLASLPLPCIFSTSATLIEPV